MITRAKLSERLTSEDINNFIKLYPRAEIICSTGGNIMWTEYAVTPTDRQIRETTYGNGGTQEKGICEEVPAERIAFVMINFGEGHIAVMINP